MSTIVYTDSQTRAVEVLKKALAAHSSKPTKNTAEVVRKAYHRLLSNTLDARVLTPEEVATLQKIVS